VSEKERWTEYNRTIMHRTTATALVAVGLMNAGFALSQAPATIPSDLKFEGRVAQAQRTRRTRWRDPSCGRGPAVCGQQLPGQRDDSGSVPRQGRQLGLELKAQKGPVDIIVIDHVERPTEN
jgi:hypothetical protein